MSALADAPRVVLLLLARHRQTPGTNVADDLSGRPPAPGPEWIAQATHTPVPQTDEVIPWQPHRPPTRGPRSPFRAYAVAGGRARVPPANPAGGTRAQRAPQRVRRPPS